MKQSNFRRILLSVAAPGAALLFALAASSVVLIIVGSNPLEAFGDMVQQASKLESIVAILNRATPLYLSGIAAAIGFRMNLFNIGVEGQFLIAALVAAQVGGVIELPAVLHVLVIFLVATTVGAAWAGVAGVLKVTKGVNEVISTIMLNSIAVTGLIAWLVQRWRYVPPDGSTSRVSTTPIAESGLLPHLDRILEAVTRELKGATHLSGMLVIAVLVGIGYHILLSRTRFGFDLRASGINPIAAHVGGVPPKRMVVIAMLLSGGIAGLVGLQQVFDEGLFPSNPVQGLGFAGIAVALLGRNHPGGVAFAALLFAFLDTSSGVLQFTGAATPEIVVIMQGIILLSAVVAYEVVARIKTRDEVSSAAAAFAGSAS